MMIRDHEYCQKAVPQSSKKSSALIAFILVGLTFFSASMWAGGTLITGLALNDFLLALIIGNLILGIYSAILGYIGAKTGLSTHLLSRFSFGVKGSWLPSLLLSVTQIGWFGVGLAIFSYPVSKITDINVNLLVIVFGVMMTLTISLEGIKGLLYLSILAVPLIAIISCYSIWMTVNQLGGFAAFIAIKITDPFSSMIPITMIIGSFISAAVLSADLVRFGSHAKSVFFFIIFAVLFGNLLLFVFTPAGNIYLLIAIFGIMIILTVVLEGIKGFFYLSVIAVPIIAILGCYSVWIALKSNWHPVTPNFDNPLTSKPISFCMALTIIIGSFISAGTLTADFVRFGRNAKNVFFVTVFAFLFGNSLMFIVGAAGIVSTGFADISNVMIAQGLPVLAIIVLGLNIWTTNDNALYTSSLGLANITGFSCKRISIINGLLGTLCATWLYHHFIDWLTFLSVAIPPIGGIIIADYILYKNYYNDLCHSDTKQINWIAFIAAAIGLFSSHNLPGVIPVNSILISGISYSLLTSINNLSKKHRSSQDRPVIYPD